MTKAELEKRITKNLNLLKRLAKSNIERIKFEKGVIRDKENHIATIAGYRSGVGKGFIDKIELSYFYGLNRYSVYAEWEYNDDIGDLSIVERKQYGITTKVENGEKVVKALKKINKIMK